MSGIICYRHTTKECFRLQPWPRAGVEQVSVLKLGTFDSHSISSSVPGIWLSTTWENLSFQEGQVANLTCGITPNACRCLNSIHLLWLPEDAQACSGCWTSSLTSIINQLINQRQNAQTGLQTVWCFVLTGFYVLTLSAMPNHKQHIVTMTQSLSYLPDCRCSSWVVAYTYCQLEGT